MEVRAEADDGARRPRGGGSHGHSDVRGSGEKQKGAARVRASI